MRYMRQMGLMDRFAGERPLNMCVAETASERRSPRMIEVGRELKDQDGAERYRDGLRRHGAPPRAVGRSARHAGDRPDAGGGNDGARRGADSLSDLSLVRVAAPLTVLLLRHPFLVTLPHVRERLAGRA